MPCDPEGSVCLTTGDDPHPDSNYTLNTPMDVELPQYERLRVTFPSRHANSSRPNLDCSDDP